MDQDPIQFRAPLDRFRSDGALLNESYSILCELIRPGAKLIKRALESG
jgi:hypothetical protein